MLVEASVRINRREFITLLGGAAAAWPLAARAQQAERMRRIGVLMNTVADDTVFQIRLGAFLQGLAVLGWTIGRNMRIEIRWSGGKADDARRYAAELVAFAPDVILAHGVSTVRPLLQATRTVPIVFPIASDPVGMGLVDSLARPGGNLTGINILSTELAAKRLELLRALVPGATRIAVLVDPTNATNTETTVRGVEAAARAKGLQIQVLNASNSREVDATFATLASERPDALLVGSTAFLADRRVQLAQLAARHAVPAIYVDRQFAEVGGLMSYGASLGDAFRQVGVYSGRILKGAKPADLPVLQSTKFELVINAPTARMLGLTVPPTLLATADEVIE